MTFPAFSDGINLSLDELLAYKRSSALWLPPAPSIWSNQAGAYQSRRLGRGMDFSEVRQYQAGDDIRNIDWRVTARTGKPHTKLFSEEKERPVILYIDLSKSMFFGSTLMLKSVQAAHMAALIGWLSLAKKDRVGGVIDTGQTLIEIKPQNSQKALLALLNTLVNVHANEQRQYDAITRFADVISTLDRLAPKGSELVLISDFTRLSSQDFKNATQLGKHNIIRLVQIYDSLEQGDTQFKGTERLTNGKQAAWVNFFAPNTRKAIKKAFNCQQDKLELLSHQQRTTLLTICADKALSSQLSGTR